MSEEMAATLEMVPLKKLKVDRHEDGKGGYARSPSEARLARLRKNWSLVKVGPIQVSQRADKSLWLIDGQHRMEVAKEKGLETLPALVHHGLTRAQEADIYLGSADALPQQALSQFMAKLSRGDAEANAIKTAVESTGLKIASDYRTAHADDGQVVAVSRLERIYRNARGAGLREVLLLTKEVWGLDHRAYQQAMLEAVYQFWAAYHTMYDRDRLVERLKEAGVEGTLSRAYAIRSHGEWSQTVDSIVVALWRIYHEPKLRSHRLPTWNGKRAKPVSDAPELQSFARNSRRATVEKARSEREQLRIVG